MTPDPRKFRKHHCFLLDSFIIDPFQCWFGIRTVIRRQRKNEALTIDNIIRGHVYIISKHFLMIFGTPKDAYALDILAKNAESIRKYCVFTKFSRVGGHVPIFKKFVRAEFSLDSVESSFKLKVQVSSIQENQVWVCGELSGT